MSRSKRRHAKLAALPGVRSLRRPVAPATTEQFDLYYVRSGPPSKHPLLIIPGGPGVASVGMGGGLRRRAAAIGLDVIMMEHRGVGMSRRTDSGADLPPSALDIDQVLDDVAAVLDHAGVGSAVIDGVSYGSYLAAGVGVRHPGRVHAMILDSPLLSRDDIAAVRAAIRELFLAGPLASKTRQLVDRGVLTAAGAQIGAALYGFSGMPLLDRQLDLLLHDRTRLWRMLNRIAKSTARTVPYRNEPDLVGRIAFRELDYAPEPDGLPLDPAVAIREIGYTPVAFESEPFNLAAEMPKFNWPTVVISGGRDLTTPAAVAERITALIPDAVLASLPTMGHGALTSRQPAALAIAAAVCRGDTAGLSSQGPALDALPAAPAVRVATALVAAAAALEGVFLAGQTQNRT